MTASRRSVTFPVLLIGLAALAAALLLIPWDVQGQSSETEVAHDWGLVPDGIGPGDPFRLLIQTSGTRDATATDMADYNTFVQNLVASGHLAIQEYKDDFRAVGCTNDVDALTNTSMDGTGVPVYWLDGRKAADDYHDFYDGSWDPPRFSATDELGDAVDTSSDSYVLTGCERDGTKPESGFLGATGSVEWTSASDAYGDLNTNSGGDPDDAGYFYAVSGVFRVAGIRPDAVQASIDAAGDAGEVQRVLPDWPLVPDGRRFAGARFRLLFVTYRDYGGGAIALERDTLASSIGAYHAFVRNSVDDHGHPGIVPYSDGMRVVAASVDQTDYISNASLGTPDVPIYWLGGGKVASNLAGFTDLNAPPVGTSWVVSWENEATGRYPDGEPHEFPADFSDHASFVATGIRAHTGSGAGRLGNTTRFTHNSLSLITVDAGIPNHSSPQANPLASVSLATVVDDGDPITPHYYGISPTFHVLPCYEGLHLLCAQLMADAWSTDDDFRRGYASRSDSDLSDSNFQLGGVTYTVGQLATFVPHGDAAGELTLSLTVSPALPAADLGDYELYVASADRSFPLSDAEADTSTLSGSGIYTWADSDVGWFEGMGDLVIVQLSNPPDETEVAHDWGLVPDGIGPGDPFRLLIQTSGTRDATATDMADYNTFVQNLVASGHLAIQEYKDDFRAVGCTNDVDALTNTSMDGTGVPVYWLDGRKAADDYHDFYDGSWDPPRFSATDELGDAVDTSSDSYVLTGCERDGTKPESGFLGATGSVEWTSASDAYGDLNTNSGGDPDDAGYFYAVSGVFRVAGIRPDAVQASIDAAGDAGEVQRVLPDWPLVPDGRRFAGARFRLLFVTYRDYGGGAIALERDTLASSIGAYHAFVRNSVDDHGHPGIVPYSDGMRVVAASVDQTDYISNASLGTPDVPIYWLGGGKVASNLAGFTDLNAPPVGTSWVVSWENEATGRYPDGEPHEFPRISVITPVSSPRASGPIRVPAPAAWGTRRASHAIR